MHLWKEVKITELLHSIWELANTPLFTTLIILGIIAAVVKRISKG